MHDERGRKIDPLTLVYDDGAVQEPVEHRGGDGGVVEDCAPGADAPV